MDMIQKWFCVRCKSKQEIPVETRLRSKNIEVYLPRMAPDLRKGRVSPEPLFSNYLFVHMAEGIDDFHEIRQTAGVSGIVKFNRVSGYLVPTPINPVLIEVLKSMETNGINSLIKSDYSEGDEIIFKSGPFKDYKGFIQKLRTRNGKKRAMILISALMGRVESDLKDVEPAA